ncbi:MAG: MFS transporter [Rhizobiales bacterium 24-66-13]|jgi:MFS family permease|uniref:MFS transporter n=1 Tax=Roseixanthobacter finlandensis TaxID=3119922 RepID=UPI000BDB38DE|nr:MAG: MFS transporter [Rhizobiales bacterium 24-66-13]HQS10409.1 MFS transporter [Xanthobacteraceae bacterium]HQS45968.1 MFS transporter [Xanthobacteraceae bacterium]
MDATTISDRVEGDLTRSEEKQVVLASTLGTIFEWYDFFIYGSLAVFMSQVLFPPDNPTAALLASLGALAAGFVIRPIGAVLFGRLGDMVGRKYTFLITIIMMGGSTALIGFLPSYATIGHTAWISLVVLRLLQGLAVGGEYGGAVVYVAEHSRPERRGLLTGWIQITSSIGLALSVVVILGTQASMSEAAFKDWGWRLPFIISIAMLAFSVYVRAKLHESPVFARMKAEQRLSKSPIKDTFGRWSSLRLVLIALFGVTAGMGSTYFTGQFYVMIFMQQVVKIDLHTTYVLMAIGLLIGAPSFVFFGWLSDKIGRKWLMMTGLALSALLYRPMFASLLEAGNPQLVAVTQSAPVTVHADAASDGCRFGLVAALVNAHPDHLKPCVQAKKLLISSGINFQYGPPLEGQKVAISVAGKTVQGFDPAAYRKALAEAGYPAKADPARVNTVHIVMLLVAMTLIVAMIYGPVASFLVEFFPANIRYTALSFPYHIGAGIFGGFLPFFATWLSLSVGDVFAGLWYPVVITAVVCVIGSILLPNRPTLARDA